MREVIVLQHEPGEGAGSLLPLLGAIRLVRTFAGEPVPAHPGDARAVVVLGGGMGVYDQERHGWLRDELHLVRRCLSAERPVLGICLGSQLLAAALGAEVRSTGSKEIGFHRVELTPGASDDALFRDLGKGFVAFHWHGDQFDLPQGAVPLASSAFSPLQAFRFGSRAWGIQFHLEVDDAVLRAMVEGGESELAEEGIEPDALLAEARRELPRMQQIASTVFGRWAAQL